MGALVIFVKVSRMIQLESALEGGVPEECLTLYNVDGSMHKNAKNRFLELFNLDQVAEKPTRRVSFVDIGLKWWLATQVPEDREARKWDGFEYACRYLDTFCTIVFLHHADAHLIIKEDEHD